MVEAIPHPDAKIAVIRSVADSLAAETLEVQIARLGVQIESVPSGGPVVVLFSTAAVDDPEWQREVVGVRSRKLVPVRVGTVSDDRVPVPLRALHWIDYGAGAEQAAADILVAISLNADFHRAARDVATLARQWEEFGYIFLLTSLRDIRRRERALDRSTADLDQDTLQIATRFLHESRDWAREQRLLFIWNVAWRSVAASAAIGMLILALWVHHLLFENPLADGPTRQTTSQVAHA